MQFFHSSVANILTVTCAIFFGVDAQYASTNGVNFIVNGKSFTYAGTNVYDGEHLATSIEPVLTLIQLRCDQQAMRATQ